MSYCEDYKQKWMGAKSMIQAKICQKHGVTEEVVNASIEHFSRDSALKRLIASMEELEPNFIFTEEEVIEIYGKFHSMQMSLMHDIAEQAKKVSCRWTNETRGLNAGRLPQPRRTSNTRYRNG